LAAKIDDIRVKDTEVLFRLVPALPSTARRNPQTRIIEITSSVFHTSALSALRLSEIEFLVAKSADAKLNRNAKPDYGVAIFSAEFVRHSLGCIVCIEDEQEFPTDSHVGICGGVDGRPLTGRQYKILTLAAHLALPPNIP
jgi:hypothetical protein